MSDIKRSIKFAQSINRKMQIKRHDNQRIQVKKSTLDRVYKYIQDNYLIQYGSCCIKQATDGHYFYDIHDKEFDLFITYYT